MVVCSLVPSSCFNPNTGHEEGFIFGKDGDKNNLLDQNYTFMSHVDYFVIERR